MHRAPSPVPPPFALTGIGVSPTRCARGEREGRGSKTEQLADLLLGRAINLCVGTALLIHGGKGLVAAVCTAPGVGIHAWCLLRLRDHVLASGRV